AGLKCGFPGRPAYGRISLIRDSYEEGQQVAYSCDSGFNLLGQSSRDCLRNGTWSGTLPVCDTSLAIQRIPETSGYLYAYPPANALDGSKTSCFYTTHQHPRWWRVDLGAAYHVLSVAITVPHVNSRQDLVVSVISYEGNKATFNRCAAFSGKFSTQTVILMCDEGKGIVGQFIDVTDKRKDPDYFSLCEVEVYVLRGKHRASITLGCSLPPYSLLKLTNPLLRYCNSYTSLTTGFGLYNSWHLAELACPSLGPLENGRVAVRGASNGRTVQGSQLVYVCDPGYTLDGNDTRTCQEDARWGGQQPHCQPVTCEMPTFEVDGGAYRLLNVSTSYGDLAELNCHLGYERQGTQHTVVCQEDGTWSKPESSCVLRQMKQKLKEQSPSDATDTSSTLTGMVAAVIAIAFLFLLSMCVLLLLKRRKYFSSPKGQPPKQAAAAAAGANNGGANISYTESSGTIYQNEDFYMEIPLKPPHQNGTTSATANNNNNNHHPPHPLPRQSSKPDGAVSATDRRKSSTPSHKSSASSRENIYEEIALAASKSRRLSFGGNSAVRKSNGVVVAVPPTSIEERKEVQSPGDSPALYAKVDFNQKRKSRMVKEQSEDTPQKSPPETGVKLRDLPPIPPPEEEEERTEGRGAVAMSLDGAVTPMASLAPHVVEGGNVYVGHPLATDSAAGDVVMVDNELYVTS
ncbi:unnamed protein product, partial [Ixodes hexagonus]